MCADHVGVPISKLVTRVLGRHEALLQTAEGLMDTPEGRSAGATLKKSKEKKRAIAAALPVANAMYLLYLEDEDDEQGSEKAHALKRFKTDYDGLPGALTLAETRNVAKQAAVPTMKTKLADEAEIDSEELGELDEANKAFSNLLTAPKLAREKGKTKRTALGTALKAADLFVDSDLRPATKTMKGEAAGFRDALLEAMRIDDAASPGKGPGPDEVKPTPAPAG
ncbi:hypothetical protein [Hymenobacter aranciens]|uniref:hypothetical protein n=1 Tax=Hymenobacter aranciens TaxID=3063996 RepID=UPI00272A0218|nr:hypothetical protein [Hymenobacter sp. ASUV-10]